MLIGERQILDIDVYYLQYEFVREMIDLWNIFCNDNIEEALKDIELGDCSKKLIESMEVGLGRKIDGVRYRSSERKFYGVNSGNNLTVCFSGGKDSLAAALKYIDLGYKVNLYKVDGINKGYPKEVEAAKVLASALGLPLEIEKIGVKGKKFYIEHPLKNQMICTLAFAYCIENKLDTHIVFGDFKSDVYSKSHYGIDWSDCKEVWDSYLEFIRNWIPDAEIDIAFDDIDDSYDIMSNNTEYLSMYQSCLMNMRYRDSLNRKNKEKYNVSDMLPNRCGSCWKCAMEYIYFADSGALEYNREYYRHCLDVLKSNFSGAKSELPKPKNREEAHNAYFVKKKYKDGKYYKDTLED